MNELTRREIGLGLAGSERLGVNFARVSVIMVVFHTGPALATSIGRVLKDAEVDEFILVDNGSSAGEREIMDSAAERDARVTVLRGQGNIGFARGANMGAKAAHGSILLFLNPDAYIEPGCVTSLLAALHKGRDLRLVGALVANPDGSEQRGSRRGEVTPVTTLLSLTRLTRLMKSLQRFEVHWEARPLPADAAPTPTVSGACFAIRRSHFLYLGGFDERYFLHVEDIDLCWRVRQSGGEVWLQPSARVIHFGSTSHAHPLKIEYHKGRGLVRYFCKRADTPSRWVLARLLAPGIMLAAVVRGLARPHRRRPAAA